MSGKKNKYEADGLPDFTPAKFYTENDALLCKKESLTIIERIKEIILSNT